MSNDNLLNCDAIEMRPVAIDWQAAAGEDFEGYIVYQATECPTCGKLVVSSTLGENAHRDLVSEDNSARKCEGNIVNEGPMMDYWYPVKLPHLADAALAIAHLPLCVVEFENGATGLALTGGGMNLSWEICEAFILLGYLPPVHFCDLPGMAGKYKEKGTQEIIARCTESCKVAASWANRKADRLFDLGQSMLVEARNEKKAAKPATKRKAKK